MLDFNEQIRRPQSREMDTANRLQYSTSGDVVDKTESLYPMRSGDRLLKTGEKLLSDPRIEDRNELSSIHSVEQRKEGEESEHSVVNPLPRPPEVSPLTTEKEGPSIEMELRKREEEERQRKTEKDEYDDYEFEEEGKAEPEPMNTNPLLPVQSSVPLEEDEYEESFERLC